MLLLIAGLTIAAAAATPSPSTPPEIGHVTASRECVTYRENVRHALEGLLANDRIIDQTKSAFVKMAHDFGDSGGSSLRGYAHRSAAIRLDTSYMEQLVGSLTKNLANIESLLADPERFPEPPKTQKERDLQKLKTRLRAVAVQQQKALDVLSGVADTYNFQDISGFGNPLNAAIKGPSGGKSAPAGAMQGPGAASKSSLLGGSDNFFDSGPLPTIAQDPALAASGETSFMENSPFARFYAAIFVGQLVTQRLETTAAQMLMEQAPACVGQKT